MSRFCYRIVVGMLFFALFFSSTSALETALNITDSGTAQSQLTSAAASSSIPQTITDVVQILPQSTITEQLENVSSKPLSSASGSGVTSSPTLTDGPIYTTVPCYGDAYGQNCNRSPEYPFWNNVITEFVGPAPPLGPWITPTGITPPGMVNPWAYFTSGNLESASSCAALFHSSLDNWLATASITTWTTVVTATTVTSTLESFSAIETDETSIRIGNDVNTYTETISGVLTTSTDTTPSATIYSTYVTTVVQQATTETIIYSAWTPYLYKSLYTPTFTSPCCSSCSISGGNIKVMYFPHALATEVSNNTATLVSTVVDSKGFTFTSPTIYMSVQTLIASNLCGQVGALITSGTTLSFAPDALSTAPAYSSAGSLYTFYPNWQPFSYSPAIFGTAPCTDVVTTTGVVGMPAVEVTYNPCYPYISVPPEVRSADPLWSTCVDLWSIALYDPPYVISAAEGRLSAFSLTTTTPTADPITSTAPVISTTDPASPGSTTELVTAPTTTSTLSPTTAPTAADIPPASSSDPVAVDPSTSISSVAVDPGTSSSLVIVEPANPSLSSSLVVVDPANVSPSISPVAADPGNDSTSSAGGVVFNPSNPIIPPAGVITVGGSTIAIDPLSGFVIGTQTLTPGRQITLASGSKTLIAGGLAITIWSTVVSLQTGGSSVVIGGTTTEASSAFLGSTTPSAGGLGGIIASVGGFGTSTSGNSGASSTGLSTYNGTVFTGKATKREATSIWSWGLCLGVGIVGVAQL